MAARGTLPAVEAMAPTGASRRVGRPTKDDPVAGPDEIVDAAIRAVRQHGPEVTMDLIAAEAGVGKPTIYRSVGNREAIAKAVAEHLAVQVESLTQTIRRGDFSSAELRDGSQFHAIARAFFELMEQERNLFFFVEQGSTSNDGEQPAALVERSAAPLLGAFTAARTTRHIGPNSARTWAYATVGLMRSVAVAWLRDPYCSAEELTNDVVEFVFPASGVPSDPDS